MLVYTHAMSTDITRRGAASVAEVRPNGAMQIYDHHYYYSLSPRW